MTSAFSAAAAPDASPDTTAKAAANATTTSWRISCFLSEFGRIAGEAPRCPTAARHRGGRLLSPLPRLALRVSLSVGLVLPYGGNGVEAAQLGRITVVVR